MQVLFTVRNDKRPPREIKAKPVYGVTKYGSIGLFSTNSFPGALDLKWKEYLAVIANHSLSKSTWSTYATAGRMLKKCQDETNFSMSLPLDQEKILIFVTWLLARKLTAKTINAYLSGLRQVHLAQGIPIPILRPSLIQQLLTGATNMDHIRSRLKQKPVRLPVTPTSMKLFKLDLKESSMTREMKRLVWSIATLCFNGAFRIHELLSRNSRQFDPNFTLLGRDVKLKSIKIQGQKVSILQVKLKSPKTDRVGVDTIVDVYESGGPLCPLRAFSRWRTVTTHKNKNFPLFTDDQGLPFTGKRFNAILKDSLGKYLDYNKGRITSHSFRAGIASLLGVIGFSEEEIQAVGRWSSRAYLDYLKLPRTKRLEMARLIGNLKM